MHWNRVAAMLAIAAVPGALVGRRVLSTAAKPPAAAAAASAPGRDGSRRHGQRHDLRRQRDRATGTRSFPE